MRAGWWSGVAVVMLGLAACGPSERKDAAAPDSAAGAAMGDMPGMAHGGGSESARLITEMRAHLQSVAGAEGDSLRRMMPMHRQMTANLLQQMEAEMRQMRMTGDTAWTALTDSVRQDLTTLPEVGVAELPGFMGGHRARVERLMAQHDAMMKAH